MPNLQSAALFVFLALPVAFAESLEPEPRSIIHKSAYAAVQRLNPWLERFLAQPRRGNPIEVYELVDFDDVFLAKLRLGEVDHFEFRLNEEYSYSVIRDSVTDFDGGWMLNGYLPNRKDMSVAKIIVKEDGSKLGDVFVMRVGRFNIEPSPELPHHVVYLSTGTYEID